MLGDKNYNLVTKDVDASKENPVDVENVVNGEIIDPRKTEDLQVRILLSEILAQLKTITFHLAAMTELYDDPSETDQEG